MGELSKIISDLNLPKHLLDKGEEAFKAVLGPSIKEFSETIADNFRLRRFRNQVKILTKAQEILKRNNLTSKKVELKVLAPLIEFSSLEEDEILQEKWSNLIANIVTIDGKTLLKQNCIEILKRISNDEVKFLDHLFGELSIRRIERLKMEQPEGFFKGDKKSPTDLPLHWFSFSLKVIGDEVGISRAEIDLIVSNMVALGLLKWEPEVNVISAEKSYADPSDQSLNIDIEVFDSESIRLTNLGFEFVNLCSEKY